MNTSDNSLHRTTHQTYRRGYILEVLEIIILGFISLFSYLLTVSSYDGHPSKAVAVLIGLLVIAVIHFGSAKLALNGDVLKYSVYFGLKTKQVDLSKLSTLSVDNIMYSRGGASYRLNLTDTQGERMRFRMGARNTGFHNGKDLLTYIQSCAQKTGAAHNANVKKWLPHP